MVTFKYNNKQYTTNNLDSKLNKLGISKDDIEILESTNIGNIDTSIKKYYFYNKDDKSTIVSIYDNLDNMKNYIDISKYERI